MAHQDGSGARQARLKLLLGLLAVSCEPPTLDQLTLWMGPGGVPFPPQGASPTYEVESLLQSLGTLFVTRSDDGKVRGFHKSIYDWLLEPKVWGYERSFPSKEDPSVPSHLLQPSFSPPPLPPRQDSGQYAVDAPAAHRQLGAQLSRGALVTLGILHANGSSNPQGPNPTRGREGEALSAAASLDPYTLQFTVRRKDA